MKKIDSFEKFVDWAFTFYASNGEDSSIRTMVTRSHDKKLVEFITDYLAKSDPARELFYNSNKGDKELLKLFFIITGAVTRVKKFQFYKDFTYSCQKTYNSLFGSKDPQLQHLTVKHDWPMIREFLRLYMGTYEPIVFNAIPERFCKDEQVLHMSMQNPKLIAYTENTAKGKKDIQIRSKVGKYIKKYFPDESASKIGYITDRFNLFQLGEEISKESQNYKLKFAKTADEIEWIYSLDINLSAYEDGYGSERSCMQYDAEEYYCEVHPCRVYGGDPRIAVAYLEDKYGNVVARSIVNLEKKEFVRTYFLPDYSDIFEKILYSNGFSYNSKCLEGTYLSLIWIDYYKKDGFIAPYLDGGFVQAKVNMEEGRLELCEYGGDVVLNSTRGYYDFVPSYA